MQFVSPVKKRDVVFKDVTFGNKPDSNNFLKNLSFHAEPGENHA